MTHRIKERIEIAREFKPVYFYHCKELSPKERDKRLKRAALLDYRLVSVLLLVVIFASAMTLFEVGSFSEMWDKAGLLVLMAMALSFRAPFSNVELMLQSHIYKIENLDLEFDPTLNLELKKLLEHFNKRKEILYLVGLPAIVVFIGSLLQIFDVNPYWNQITPLVLAVSVYLLVRINNDVRRLKRILNNIWDSN